MTTHMKGATVKFPKCNDSRPCFAKRNGECMALNSTYKKDGDCPFCKAPRREWKK